MDIDKALSAQENPLHRRGGAKRRRSRSAGVGRQARLIPSDLGFLLKIVLVVVLVLVLDWNASTNEISRPAPSCDGCGLPSSKPPEVPPCPRGDGRPACYVVSAGLIILSSAGF